MSAQCLQMKYKNGNLKSLTVDSPPHPLLILGHPVEKNLVERTNQKPIQRYLEIQTDTTDILKCFQSDLE